MIINLLAFDDCVQNNKNERNTKKYKMKLVLILLINLILHPQKKAKKIVSSHTRLSHNLVNRRSTFQLSFGFNDSSETDTQKKRRNKKFT